jgi:YVTN family beta-propeller protein
VLTHYYKDIPIYLILIISVYQIFDFQFEYSFALSLTTTIPVQNDPRFSAFDNETNKLYVTNHQSANVSVIDGASDTVIKNIKVGKDPFHLIHASTPTGEKIYVANIDFSDTEQDSISVISTSIDEVIADIPIGVDPSL